MRSVMVLYIMTMADSPSCFIKGASSGGLKQSAVARYTIDMIKLTIKDRCRQVSLVLGTYDVCQHSHL
jgi:hypothetical protein